MFASSGISFTTKSALLDASPSTCHMHDLHTFVICAQVPCVHVLCAEEGKMAVRQMEALPTDHGVKEVPNPEDSQTKEDA